MYKNSITALRMERQHLTRKANEDEYISLYGDGDYGPDETALLIKRF